MHEKKLNFCGYELAFWHSGAVYYMDTTRILASDLHSHSDSFEVFYVKFGECTIEVDSVSYQLYMNDILIVSPNISHCMRSVSENAVVSCCPFTLKENEKKADFLNKVSPCLKISASPLLASIWNYIGINGKGSQHFNQREILIRKLIFAEIITLIIEKSEVAAKYEAKKIKSYLDMIDSFFSNPDNYSLRAQDLADSMHISVRHLNRLLMKYLGDSFGNIMHTRRITLAKWMLRNTKTPIDQIYDKVGYTSKSVFFKVFKQQLGVTPKQYRDSLLSFKKKNSE